MRSLLDHVEQHNDNGAAGTEVATSEFTTVVGLAGKLRSLHPALLFQGRELYGMDVRRATDSDHGRHLGCLWRSVQHGGGEFQQQVPGISEHCMLSCPTVISGRDYHCRPAKSVGSTNLTMIFEGRPLGFVLQIHK